MSGQTSGPFNLATGEGEPQAQEKPQFHPVLGFGLQGPPGEAKQ